MNTNKNGDALTAYCPRCGNTGHELDHCAKFADIMHQPSQFEVHEQARRAQNPKSKPRSPPNVGWPGQDVATRYFRERDFRSWVMSAEGHRVRGSRKGPQQEYDGLVFGDLDDLARVLAHNNLCRRCGQSNHVWPACDQKVSLDQSASQQNIAWPNESEEERFQMERKFKFLVESARLSPPKHADFLVPNAEPFFISHFEPASQLPPRRGISDNNVDIKHTGVDTRPDFSGHIPFDTGDTEMDESYAPRTSFAQEQEGLTVLTNHLILNLNDDIKLYRYSLGGTGADSAVARGKKKDQMERFVRESNTLRNRRDDFATDSLSHIVSWQPLYNQEDTRPENATMETQYFKALSTSGKPQELSLVFLGCLEVNSFKNYVTRPSARQENIEPFIRALNMIILKGAMENATADFKSFQIGNNRIFRKSGYNGIAQGVAKQRRDNPNFEPSDSLLVCHRGYFSTVGFGMGKILLNVNTSTSVFYRPMMLIDFIKNAGKYFSLPRDLASQKCHFEKILKGVRVWITYDHARDSKKLSDSEKRSSDPFLMKKTIKNLGNTLEKQLFEKEVMKKGKLATEEISVFDHMQSSKLRRKFDNPEYYCD